MLRIITLNLNGIRSAARKGFFDWLQRQDADLVCLQELKAQAGDLPRECLHPEGYFGYFHCAEKKGYSGVGLYSRRPPEQVIEGFGIPEFDAEGRYLEAVFGKLSVVSVYLPSGSSSPERQAAKFRFLERFRPHLEQLRRSRREVLLCGDWNIAHREIDLKNWKGNLKNSGFLPEERAWMSEVFGPAGFVDVYRRCIRRPKGRPIPGGRTAARRGRRTSAGASTTRSPRPAWPPPHAGQRFTRGRGSPITRPSRSITIMTPVDGED